MEIIYIDSIEKKDHEASRRAAEALSRGEAIILPAGTIYGLSCLIDHEPGFQKIYSLKKRSGHMPLIILFSEPGQLSGLILKPRPEAKKLMEHFWFSQKPQALTLVMTKHPKLAGYVTAGKESIALRFAPPGFLHQVIGAAGPITSTSATLSGTKTYPDRFEKIPQSIRKGTNLAIASKSSLPGIESTIVDISGPAPSLIREGIVGYEQVCSIWGRD